MWAENQIKYDLEVKKETIPVKPAGVREGEGSNAAGRYSEAWLDSVHRKGERQKQRAPGSWVHHRVKQDSEAP